MRTFLRRIRELLINILSDARLIILDRVGRDIGQNFPRDISTKEYWDSSSTLELMVDSYLRKDDQQIRRFEYIKSQFGKVLSDFDIQKSAQILEIGCGFGFTLKGFANQFPSFIFNGSDFSRKLIEYAGDYTKGVKNIGNLYVQDIVADPISRSFEVIYTHGCLTCLDPKTALHAIKKMANASGLLVLIELDFSNMNYMERLRFKRDRNYKVIDYSDLISEAKLNLKYVNTLPSAVCKYTKIYIIEGLCPSGELC